MPKEKKNKKNELSSVFVLVLIIIVIWGIIYFLFLNNPDFKTKQPKKNIETTEKEPSDEYIKDEKNKEIAEENALIFVDSAKEWHSDALKRYGSLVDVRVLFDGRVVKLNKEDNFNLDNEKINVETLPDSINSMIISKEGIIVISQIDFNNYCFDYDGDNLTNVECK